MDAKTFYEQIAPELDPEGFKLYFTAKRMTGFDLYGQFPYEDSRGMFTMMNGHQLMRYLLADQFHAVRAFEQKLYTAVLQNCHLSPHKRLNAVSTKSNRKEAPTR